MPKALVNVILDRVLDQEELLARAVDGAQGSKARLFQVAKALHAIKGTEARKREAFRTAFVALVLAELARNTPAAVDLTRASVKAELAAIVAVGPEKMRAIPALHKADVMARAAERRGLNG